MDQALTERLCAAFAKKRVWDFFRDFDKTGIRRIHPVQAVRALSACGIVLTPAEQEELKKYYTNADDGFFEYARLVDDMNNTRNNGFFEVNPDVDPASTTPTARFNLSGVGSTPSSLMPRIKMTPEEDLELARILNLARFEAGSRALTIAVYMRQYDDTRHGVVTAERFKRGLLSNFATLTIKDAELLCRAYAAPDGQVRYYAFHQDVIPDPVIEKIEPVRSTSPNVRLLKSVYGAGAAPRTNEQAKETLATLVRQFSARRIRSTDIFRGYDRQNCGRIARPAFIRGLGSCRFTGVTLADLEALADGYADLGVDPDGGMVRWRDFCDDVEAAQYLRPSLVQVEKHPGSSNTTFAAEIMAGPVPGSTRPDLGAELQAKLFAVMADIKGTVVRYSLWRIADMLLDFDKAHEGHITADRFLRVLAMCSCAPSSTVERDVLLKYFGGEGPKAGLVNYRAFLEHLDLKSAGIQGT